MPSHKIVLSNSAPGIFRMSTRKAALVAFALSLGLFNSPARALTLSFSFELSPTFTSGCCPSAPNTSGFVRGYIGGLSDNSTNDSPTEGPSLLVKITESPNTPPGGWPDPFAEPSGIPNDFYRTTGFIQIQNGVLVDADISFGAGEMPSGFYTLVLRGQNSYLSFVSSSAPSYFNGSGINLPAYSLSSDSPAAAVPGPLPVLGVVAAFGWSRRLRKRICDCSSRALSK